MKMVLFILLFVTANAIAAVQSSPNYTVQTAVLDAGGARATSTSYANDGSIGGFGGVVTAYAPQATARIGYAGQLYEVTAFTLTAVSTNLNEATAMPLYATQFLDDGTVSPVSSLAQWSFTGPLAGIDAAGIVTADTVSQDTSAAVQARLEGWVAGLNLMVINTGTLPVLPGYNQILGQVLAGGQMSLTFVGSNGVNYVLERSFSLAPANWIPQVTNPAAVNGVLIFTNTPDPATNNFWRIRSVL